MAPRHHLRWDENIKRVLVILTQLAELAEIVRKLFI
jgi:hypothetical protein